MYWYFVTKEIFGAKLAEKRVYFGFGIVSKAEGLARPPRGAGMLAEPLLVLTC
jgi:hypothetical protein